MKITEMAMAAQYGQAHGAMGAMHDQQLRLKTMRDEAMQKLTRESTKSTELQQMLSKLEQLKDMSKKLGDQVHQLQLTIGGRRLMDIDVIEAPRVAETPSFPRVGRILAVAAVLGGLLGAGLALFMDRRDYRMRSVEEVQAIVGLPVLGVVPAMNGGRSAVARAMAVHLDPRSVVAEAYRTIRTAVFFGAGNSGCKTILVTSPEPGDGKTTSASNLAIAIAQTGRSVLLLDADFRKPTQHKNLEIRDSAGLSSVLAGHAPLERVVQRTQVDCLDILPCGPIPANPSEILNSREFGELIDSLVTRYDHILFDSPPVNPVTDARILGAICDSTILVLRADKSTRQSGEHARNALLAVGARLMGAIINDAPHGKGYGVYGGSYYGSSTGGAAIPQRRLHSGKGQQASQSESTRRRNIA
jgi:capsular exopolysaccharide synthesis family protein